MLLSSYINNLFDFNNTNPEANWYYTYTQSAKNYYRSETDTEVVLEMQATDILKSDLKVEVVDNVLHVSGSPQKGSKFGSSIQESWHLNEQIDVKNISAKLENGVLKVTLPKVKLAKKTVSVTVS